MKKGNLPSKYVEIQNQLPSSDHKAKFVMYLFSEGPREYDFLLKILSLGRDRYWRRSIIQEANIERGDAVLDIACGTGLVSFEVGLRGARVVGVDVTREMLRRALVLYKKDFPSQNVDFIQARAEFLPIRSDSFSCSTISLATRNVSSVPATFREMGRCIKKGGVVLSMDFTRPAGNLFASFYDFYIFHALPALGLIISRHWNGIFSYLANSIKRSRTPEQVSQIMQNVGLSHTKIQRMTRGVTAVVAGKKLNEISIGVP